MYPGILQSSNVFVAWRRVVPDGVASPEADPLGNRAVLLLSFGKLLLGAEGLVGLLNVSRTLARERTSDAYRHRD